MTFRYVYVFSYCVTASVCALSAFAILMKLTSDVGRESEVKAFKAVVINLIIFDVSNAIWIWSNYGYLPSFLRIPLKVINLSAFSLLACFWFIYVETRLGTKKDFAQIKKLRVISLIPLVVALFGVVASPFTGWIFYYTADGTFMRGPLYITHGLVITIYTAFAFFHTIGARLGAKTETKKNEYNALITLMICPLVAFVIYVFIYGLPVFELAMLFGILVVFINMQVSRIYTDALTELNNRRYADEVLFTKIKSVTMRNPFYLFIADLDGFKKINDTYGHIEGDRALKIMADTFKKIGSEQRGFFARWGGDEFTMIIEHQYLDSPIDLIHKIRAQLAREVRTAALPYTFTCSIGYAVCMSPNTDISGLTKEADAMLYEDKKVAHSHIISIAPHGDVSQIEADETTTSAANDELKAKPT